METQKIFSLLERHRLEKHYNEFLTLGIEIEADFLDSVTDKNLDDMGFSTAEKNRFSKLTDFIKRVGTATVKKSLQAFQLSYMFPGCQEHKDIAGMDPDQNTVEDLMLRICYQENVGAAMSVCLFTAEGMPLTDDPFFNTWSLKDRYIEHGSKLSAIFTAKENLRDSPQCPKQKDIRNEGPDSVRCHIMLKGNYDIRVDLEQESLADLRTKLSVESGIPAHVLYHKDKNYRNSGETLKDFGISEDETVHFILSTFHDSVLSLNEIFHSDVKPSVPQSQKGLSIFYSTLQAIKGRHGGDEFKKVIAHIRKLSGCNALAQSLYQLICSATTITKVQKIAVVEGLYFLFRRLLPSPTKRHGDKIIEDEDVFEHSFVCWAYLLSQGELESSEHENYAPVSLKAQSTGQRFSEPVRVPGVPEVFDREYVLEKIKDGEKIPNCTEQNLQETSIQRATKIEKILLSLPPSINTFPLWISYNDAQSSGRTSPEKTYAQLSEALAEYPHINITPPLQLKSLGVDGPRLVHLSEENVGMFISKDKLIPQKIVVFDCLSGKVVNENADELANRLRDVRADLTFRVTKTPKEAIVVLFDSSSSMKRECFDAECQMKRIDAIKQVFDSFSNRSMAYDFHHVICLVKFDSNVKTLHTFTENMETFKEYVHSLRTSTGTLLYDALNHGIQELSQVKARFPDCRCRILCLTDGTDTGSTCTSVEVAKKLITSNIVVDAVIVGSGRNTLLHGINNVTGGCCFKPETIKAAMQLFEMETVLSMELRKEKRKFDVSSITNERDLKNIFKTRPYEEKPETKLPPQINSKVTVTQNILKKKIMESKSGRFLEKEKRILEELKSLHCDPHPYCTVLPSESDFNFWKILMQGPPETPYENGVFELYCEFGPQYPVKPPLMRFFTPIYHCNVNSVGRICHNIFDRNYSAHITMREILDAVYGLLIAPEPEDPLDSILAEEYMTSKEKYEEEARKSTENNANPSMDEAEKKYVPELSEVVLPQHLVCSLTKKPLVDPVKTEGGFVYERKAIEDYIKRYHQDPQTKKEMSTADLKEDKDMKKLVQKFRRAQIQ